MTKRLIFLVLSFIASGCTAASILGDSALNHRSSSGNEITIMTYNIKMLPRGATFLHHHPVKRAKLIPAKLVDENPDVIVFQEAFDGKAIRTLKRKLKSAYPYIAGQDNRKLVTYKRSGGVLMFSKYPLKELESIRYSECKGIDCAGNKGAMLVEVEDPAMKFQLFGTHMQAGGSKEIKLSQYQEAGALLERHQQKGVPQFIAGDFNTHKDDTALYPELVKALKAEDGALDNEEQALTEFRQNDLRGGKPNRKKRGVIDYIFVKENGVKILWQRRYAREFKQRWSDTHEALSDHFAVILKVKL